MISLQLTGLDLKIILFVWGSVKLAHDVEQHGAQVLPQLRGVIVADGQRSLSVEFSFSDTWLLILRAECVIVRFHYG